MNRSVFHVGEISSHPLKPNKAEPGSVLIKEIKKGADRPDISRSFGRKWNWNLKQISAQSV